MPASLQTVTNILKERYEGGLNKQLRQDVPTLRRIERTSEGVSHDIGGKYAVFAIHTTRNSGIGARKEGELLPAAGQQGTEAGRVSLKYFYGTMGMTGQTFELANSNPEAFVDAMDLERDGLKDDLAVDMNRQVWGDGSGVVATSSAAYTVNTIITTNAQYLQDKMQVDVLTSAGAARALDRQVVSVDYDTNTVVLSGAAIAAGAAGDIIVRKGNYNNEWTGLSAIVKSTGTLYNINPALVPLWKGVENANGGTPRAISEGLMMAFYQKLRKNGGKPTAIFTSPGTWLSYWQLLVQQRQFVNTKDFTGGFSGLAFTTPDGEVPVVQDFDAKKGEMLFLDEKKIKIYREHDFKFADRDGSMWDRRTGYDAYDAWMYQYSELGTTRRNAHGVIRDLTETSI